MDEIHSVRPLIALLIPVVAVMVSAFIPKGAGRLKKSVFVLGSLASFTVVLSMLPDIISGATFALTLFPVVEQITISLTVDSLGYYYGLVVSFLWVLATVYSLGYIKHGESRFFSFMALCNFSLLGCAFAQNMLTYFIFYEMMTFASYPLIIHEETAAARSAGLKYLAYAVSAGAVIFFALVAHYFWGGGNLSIVSSGTLSQAPYSRAAFTLIFFTYLAGFGVKAAIMPLHGWVPDAHPEAPSPASALLSGVILKAGAFGIIRVVLNIFGLELFRELGFGTYLTAISSFTIVLASVFAVTQDNLKRRLAYSSIGQVSYILLGLSLATYSGILGGLMHLAHHALMKGCLFLCAGTILARTGKRNISEMAGIGRSLPITMSAFSVAALAMMGTPLTVGFLSKWLLGVGALEAGKPEVIAVLLVSALLNSVYFLPVIYTAFFKAPDKEVNPSLESGTRGTLALILPTAVLAVLVVLGGTLAGLPGFPYSYLHRAVSLFMH